MMPESIPGSLPLAEALKAWSAPDLLRQVELAETPFTSEHLDAHQHRWLTEIVHHRLRPSAKRREPVEPQHRALQAAWSRLFADFARKFAAGEIVLCGRMAKPVSRRDADLVPTAWASKLLLHPRRNSLMFCEDVFTEVVAVQSSSAALVAEGLARARALAGSVPLATALREWTDATLIAEVCRHERAHTAYEMASYTRHPLLSDAQDLAQPSNRRWILGPPDFTPLLAAWIALENDFRARLTRGEFHLSGVMTKPRREEQSELLPGSWAADFDFDFHRNAVSFDDARYVAVMANYAAGPASNDSDDACVRETGEERAFAVSAALAGRKRGRKDARPIIEEALRMFWAALFPQGAPARPGQATELAARLIKRVEGSREWRGRQFPEHGTVRRHLPKIYERVLAEKDRATQSVQ